METARKIKIQCTQCAKSYRVNVESIQSQYIKFTCPACQAVNVADNPEFGKEAAPDYQMPEMPAARPARKSFATGFSIRSKIIFIFGALILISLVGVGWFGGTRSRTALSEQAEAFLSRNASQKAQEYSLAFERIQQEVEGVAGYTRDIYSRGKFPADLGLKSNILMPWTGDGYGSPELNKQMGNEILLVQQLVPVLKNMVARNPFATLGYLGTDSRMMVIDDEAAVVAIGQRKGFDNTQRPWYIAAKNSGKTVWTDPYVDANTQDLIVTCASPIRMDGNRLAGVIGYDVLLTTIQKDILTLDIGYNSYALLVDNKGKALVRPGMEKGDARWDKTYETTDLLHTSNAGFNAIVEKMVSGGRGVETYTTEEGEKYVAFAPLPVIGASVAVVASKAEVERPAVNIQKIIIYFCVGVTLLAIAIGFIVGNNITKPINELTEAADRISQGEMDLELMTEDRGDEIGQLTQAFNRLVTSLKIAMSVR